MERGGRLLGYDELQGRQPPGSAWGLWVAEDDEPDEVGTLHLAADPLRLRQAALLVSSGKVFSLNWRLELPDPPLFGRALIQHTIIPSARSGGHNDQIDAFNPQASTQWDGLSHFPHQTHGFYNGVPKQHITGEEGTRLGIEKWARRGIAGRLVLIDFERWIAAREREQNVPLNERYRPDTPYAITPDQVREVARVQGVTFEVGDFVLIRTGWIRWYMGLDQAQREELAGRDPQHGYAWAGMAQGEDSLRFLWDQHFAAVAADCPSFERWPAPSKTYAELLHGTLLGLWGMPIGELWDCGLSPKTVRRMGGTRASSRRRRSTCVVAWPPRPTRSPSSSASQQVICGMPGMRVKIREYRGSANHFFSWHNLTPDHRLHTTAGHPHASSSCASTALHTAPANGRRNQRKQPPSFLQRPDSLPG